MNYSRAIKTVLAIRGMSQQDLAKRMDVDEAFISRLAKPDKSPSGKTLEKLAGALEIPLYLFVLMASEQSDLPNMTKANAELLGQELLGMLLATEQKVKRPKKGW